MSTSLKNVDALLKRKIGGRFVTIGAIRTKNSFHISGDINFEHETPQTPSRPFSEKIPHIEISGRGALNGNIDIGMLRSELPSDRPETWKIVVPDEGTYQGVFFVRAFEISTLRPGDLAFDITLVSAGSISWAQGENTMEPAATDKLPVRESLVDFITALLNRHGDDHDRDEWAEVREVMRTLANRGTFYIEKAVMLDHWTGNPEFGLNEIPRGVLNDIKREGVEMLCHEPGFMEVSLSERNTIDGPRTKHVQIAIGAAKLEDMRAIRRVFLTRAGKGRGEQ